MPYATGICLPTNDMKACAEGSVVTVLGVKAVVYTLSAQPPAAQPPSRPPAHLSHSHTQVARGRVPEPAEQEWSVLVGVQKDANVNVAFCDIFSNLHVVH